MGDGVHRAGAPGGLSRPGPQTRAARAGAAPEPPGGAVAAWHAGPVTTSTRRPGAPARRAAAASTEPVPVVGAREPCPCGSGKRYKLCHGRQARAAATTLVLRPYQGLPAEADWVALREIVPAATSTARLAAGGEAVVVATVLPDGVAARRRGDGVVFLGLQGSTSSGDPSRDAAAALEAALALEPGAEVPAAGLPGPGPRLQDLLDLDAPFEVTVREDYGYWLDADGEGAAPELREALAQAGESIVPTARLAGVEAAYWAQVGVRRHLRWVLPEDEQPLLDALARLHVAGGLGVGEGSRYLGAFRAQGLLVPVWDLAPDAEPGDLEEPAAALRARLDEALQAGTPLDEAERRARAGVVARQITLR